MNEKNENKLIQAKGLERSFGKVEVLKGIDFSIEQGEQIAIQGASGSGKSTLLHILGGLDKPTGGTLVINHKDISRYSDDELAEYRNKNVGFIFQFHFLLPGMNCLENILLPGKISGQNLKEITHTSKELASELGVSHCLDKMPFEISGGEQQRINLIRAVSLNPGLILCDEPTGNLDSKNSQKVAELLKNLAEKRHSTLIVVTHDENVASHYSRKIIIEDGRLIS